MSIKGFNSQKCQQRNRVAAGRLGVNAAPMRFRGTSPVKDADGFTVLKGIGNLPQTDEGVLKLINAKLPAGAEKLTKDDIYVHYLEAANSNFIGDRYMFLGPSTLKNIGKGGKLGVSFLNSHRSGGLSTPAELPFGHTFAGRYEEGFDGQGNPAIRAWLGVYMLQGIKPNGDNGPSTDDFDKMIRTGSVRDVSVGLNGGQTTCDVCGHVIGYYDEESTDDDGHRKCGHIPGTRYGMTADEIAAQKKRDARNKKGVATYTLNDSTLGEISAVYDGAVPGAGVKQVLQLAKNGGLSRADVREALQDAFNIYGPLLPFDLSEVVEIKPAKADKNNHGDRMKTKKLANGEENPVEDEVIDEEPADEEESEDVEASDEDNSDDDDSEEDESDDASDDDFAEDEDSDDDDDEELAVTPENFAKLQAKYRTARSELNTTRKSVKLAALEKFAASMKEKIPPTGREQFSALYVALQDGTATPAHLELALAKLPKNKAFDPLKTRLTAEEPPKPVDQVAKDEEDAKAFAERRNRKSKAQGAK